MTKYSKQTYEMVAKTIMTAFVKHIVLSRRYTKEQEDAIAGLAGTIADEFINVFRADNPSFRKTTFMKALKKYEEELLTKIK